MPDNDNTTFVSVAARGATDSVVMSSDDDQFDEPDFLAVARPRTSLQPANFSATLNGANGVRRKAPSAPGQLQRAKTIGAGYQAPSAPTQTPQRPSSMHVIGWCRAIYDYDAQQPDELTIRAGRLHS